MDAFDADVLIYAAVGDHPLGRKVRALLSSPNSTEMAAPLGIGSVLLLPEILAKPMRAGNGEELAALGAVLGKLDLRPVDAATAHLAVALAASYRLRAGDAVHLATAVGVGADRFVTNNQRHFPRSITEIAVTYPSDLPDPPAAASD